MIKSEEKNRGFNSEISVYVSKKRATIREEERKYIHMGAWWKSRDISQRRSLSFKFNLAAFEELFEMYSFLFVTPGYMTTWSHALPNAVGPIWCIACWFWQRVLLLVSQRCQRPLTEKIQLDNCTAYFPSTALRLLPVSATSPDCIYMNIPSNQTKGNPPFRKNVVRTYSWRAQAMGQGTNSGVSVWEKFPSRSWSPGLPEAWTRYAQ